MNQFRNELGCASGLHGDTKSSLENPAKDKTPGVRSGIAKGKTESDVKLELGEFLNPIKVEERYIRFYPNK